MMKVWILAARPKTLVAGIAPVILGTMLAMADGVVTWWTLPFLLICGSLIQIASNFINDLEDFRKGADTYRVGPLRAVTSGLITPQSMWRASVLVVVVAFLCGQPLVYHAGWPVLGIGTLSLIASWAYTGGPYPLAYRGLGDVFAFIFFGVIAVVGTYFVHASVWSADALLLSIGPGCLAANILGVNNLRDIPTDAAVGKRTLAVRIGATRARFLYTVLMFIGLVVPSIVLFPGRGPWLFLPLICLPAGIVASVLVWRRSGAALNAVLGLTAALYMMYTIFMSLALGLSLLK